jgi:hypothetical protein
MKVHTFEINIEPRSSTTFRDRLRDPRWPDEIDPCPDHLGSISAAASLPYSRSPTFGRQRSSSGRRLGSSLAETTPSTGPSM